MERNQRLKEEPICKTNKVLRQGLRSTVRKFSISHYSRVVLSAVGSSSEAGLSDLLPVYVV